MLTRLLLSFVSFLFLQIIFLPNYGESASNKPKTLSQQYLEISKSSIALNEERDITPLMRAVLSGDVERVKQELLLTNEVNIPSRDGLTPLMVAAKEKRADILKLLITNGAEVTNLDKHGFSAILYAVAEDCLICLQEFVKHDVSLSQSAKDQPTTALNLAINNNNDEIVKLLISSGVDVNESLFAAVLAEEIKVTKELFKLGANANTSIGEKEKVYLIHLAIGEKKTKALELLVKEGANVNQVDFNGNTPLMYAAETGEKDVVQLLLREGGDAGKYNKKQQSPLIIASLNGNLPTVKLLLSKDIDINGSDADGQTSLMYASWEGHAEIVRYLIKQKANLNLVDSAGRNAFFYAVFYNHIPVVEEFLKTKAKENSEYPYLHIATMKGYLNIVDLLLDKGRDIDARDVDNNTPLLHAVNNNDLEIVKLLLKRGAKVDQTVQFNITPFLLSLEKGFSPIRDELLKAGADLNENFISAIKLKQKASVTWLLENGAEVNYRSANKITPLHAAVGSGDIDLGQLLLKKGGDINLRTTKGMTPLIQAVIAKNREFVDFLLKNGAETELTNEERMLTPLMIASSNGELEIVRALLLAKAKINAKDSEGTTPLIYAVVNGHVKIVELLLEKGGHINDEDNNKRNALLHATFWGQTDVVKLLITKGNSLNFLDETGNSLLMYAAENAHFNLVTFLVEQGANVNQRGEYDLTPLGVAARGNEMKSTTDEDQVKVIKYLVKHGADIESKKVR